jgi:hypothetical protein
MALFDYANEDALWGHTIDQGDMPTEFVDPRAAQPQGLPIQAQAAPQAAPAQPGLDWDKIITGGAGAILAGLGAGRGDYMAGPRMMQFQQQMEASKRDAAMKQEAFGMEKEKFQMSKGAAERRAKATDDLRAAFNPEEFAKDPAGAMRKLMPHMIDVDPEKLPSLIGAYNKIQDDENEKAAAQQLGALVQAATGPDGTLDPAKFMAGLSKIPSPTVAKLAKDFYPLMTAQQGEKRIAQADERQAKLDRERTVDNQRQDARNAQLASQFQQGLNQTAQIQGNIESRFNRRIDLEEEKARRVTPAQTKTVTGNRQAIAIIDDFEKSHDELMTETKGKVSAVFKGALTKNQKAKTFADITSITGNTPAEQKFAAEYNALIGSLKTLTDEVGVLTDQDAVRILNSFDPAVTPAQFKANLKARRKVHDRNISVNLESLEGAGKDVSRLRQQEERKHNQPAPGASGWSIRPK